MNLDDLRDAINRMDVGRDPAVLALANYLEALVNQVATLEWRVAQLTAQVTAATSAAANLETIRAETARP